MCSHQYSFTCTYDCLVGSRFTATPTTTDHQADAGGRWPLYTEWSTGMLALLAVSSPRCEMAQREFDSNTPLIGVVPYRPMFLVNGVLMTSRYRNSNPLEDIRLKSDGDHGLTMSVRGSSGQLVTRNVASTATIKFRGRSYTCLPLEEVFVGPARSLSVRKGGVCRRAKRGGGPRKAVTSKEDLCLVEKVSHRRLSLSAATAKIGSAVAGKSADDAVASASLLKRLSTLPWELVVSVLKYLDFDQVNWLLTSSPDFAKQFLSVHTEPEYQSGGYRLTEHLCNRLVLREGERLWIADVCSLDATVNGIEALTPLSMKPGTYSLERAISFTMYDIAHRTLVCARCTDLWRELQNRVFTTQENMVLGRSRHLYLVRRPEVGEEEPRAEDISCTKPLVFPTSTDCDYLVHVWKQGAGDWLNSSVSTCGESCTSVRRDDRFFGRHLTSVTENYRLSLRKNTRFIITKDPERVFSSERRKVLVPIKNAVAVVDKCSSETLGYLLKRQVCAVYPRVEKRETVASDPSVPLDRIWSASETFVRHDGRVIVSSRSSGLPPPGDEKIQFVCNTEYTGLHFLPTCVSDEIRVARELMGHAEKHNGDSGPDNDSVKTTKPPAKTQWHWVCESKDDASMYHEHSGVAGNTVCTKMFKTPAVTSGGGPREEALKYMSHLKAPNVCPNMIINTIDPVVLNGVLDHQYRAGTPATDEDA